MTIANVKILPCLWIAKRIFGKWTLLKFNPTIDNLKEIDHNWWSEIGLFFNLCPTPSCFL